MTQASEQVAAVADKVVKLGTFGGEPDMSFLTNGPAQPPIFPLDAMGSAAPWIAKTAKAAGVYPDYVVAALLSSASAIIGKVYSVNVDGDQWTEPCNIWSWSLGESGTGKTPAGIAIRNAVDAVEAKYRDVHETAINAKIQLAQADFDGTTDKARKHSIQVEIDDLLASKSKPPRVSVTDITKEELLHVAKRSPRGLMLDNDELTGWLESMEGYGGGGSARPTYLKAWNGGRESVDRRGAGGSIAVPRFLLSIHGGIQPDKLRDLLLKSQSDDGLAARALMFWPNVRKRESLRGNRSNPETVIRAFLRLAELREHQDETAILDYVTCDQNPDLCAVTLLEQLFAKSEEDKGQHKGKLGSAMAKMSANTYRLSGLLHLIDWAFSGAEQQPAMEIERETLERTSHIIESYSIPQAKRVYIGLDATPAERMAMDILHSAKANKTRSIRLAAILPTLKPKGYKKGNSQQRNAIRDKALEILASANWIALDKVESAGRTAAAYRFNPALFDE